MSRGQTIRSLHVPRCGQHNKLLRWHGRYSQLPKGVETRWFVMVVSALLLQNASSIRHAPSPTLKSLQLGSLEEGPIRGGPVNKDSPGS